MEDAELELLRSWRALNQAPPSLSPSSTSGLSPVSKFQAAVMSMGPSASPLLLSLLRQPDLSEFAMDVLAHSISLCCGSCAAPPALITFNFTSLHFSIKIKEVDYVKGGLGWKVWGTALLLSSRIAETQQSLINKRVLELGSGCGLCGLFAVKLGASAVVLSDCVPGILENLCENILLLPAKLCRSHGDNNDDEESSATSMKHMITQHDYIYEGEEQLCVVQVRMLDWLQDGSEGTEGDSQAFPKLLDDNRFDWIIGSDLIYDQSSIQPLVSVIYRRLQKPHGVGMFASPVRDTKELDLFLNELDILGMEANVEHCIKEEWEACINTLGQGKDGVTLYGVDHYDGGLVVVRVKHRNC